MVSKKNQKDLRIKPFLTRFLSLYSDGEAEECLT